MITLKMYAHTNMYLCLYVSANGIPRPINWDIFHHRVSSWSWWI